MKYGVEKVLNRLGLEVDSVSGEELYMKCPFHEDSSPSFSINSDTGLWMCFAGCGGGNLVQFVQRYFGINKEQAFDWLAGDATVVSKSRLRQKLEKVMSKKSKPVEKERRNYWDEKMLKPYYKYPMPDYLYDRGFTENTVREFKIGWDKKKKEIVIPIFMPGEGLVGVVTRRIDRHEYSNSIGLIKSEVLFGLDKAIRNNPKKVVLVEGALDAMWCYQNGISAVALLGSSISTYQASLLLKHFRVVCLCLDNDEAGRHGEEVARKKLVGKVVLRRISFPDEWKDVQDIKDGKVLVDILGW